MATSPHPDTPLLSLPSDTDFTTLADHCGSGDKFKRAGFVNGGFLRLTGQGRGKRRTPAGYARHRAFCGAFASVTSG
ncbi:Uncharacterised protein [Salmonella bongori]|nr:Uncharacterised protein [Salmonella bongori]